MRAVKTISVIPATDDWDQNNLPGLLKPRKRVAAYARVSTDSDEQLSSYEAQVDHYTRFIKEHSEWDFVEVYSDEGISATSTKKRDGFNRMIADALAGRIDLILTKSVSRFARNTVDTLTNVRKLREKGVEVYFEKENIYTLDSKGELLITIMSSLAQEESRSLSANVTWGKRKKFADGEFSLPYKNFLGYEKGEDKLPKIVEDQAKIIRLIYKMFLEGHTPNGIARHLTKDNVPTPAGRSEWTPSTVRNILKNEKYAGSARLQKSYVVDFLTKKSKINGGEVTSYFVENSHQAIISVEVFDLVQHELKKRKDQGYTTKTNCFSSKIVCADCGGFYGSKVWHSNDKYRRIIWQCNRKFSKTEKCKTPYLDEHIIKDAFVSVFNSMMTNRSEILDGYDLVISRLTDSTELEKSRDLISCQMKDIETLVDSLVAKNANTPLDQDEYKKRYDEYSKQYYDLKDRRSQVNADIGLLKIKRSRMQVYISVLKGQKGLLNSFDEGLFTATVESVSIRCDHNAVFIFRDDSELVWLLPEKEYWQSF